MKRLLLFFFLSINLIYSQNWITSNTQQSSVINNVSVVNDDIIWIMDQIGSNGFSISTDGGISWIHKNFPQMFTTENFYSLGILSAVDENTAYLIVSGADNANLVGLYKTTDAGNSWNKENSIFNSGSSFPNQVHFWDTNHGFAMGDGLELYVYIDGTWYDRSSSISPIGIFSFNSSRNLKIVGDTVYFLTGSGTIMKSSDKGLNWSEITTPYNAHWDLSFDFKDDLNGILVYNNNTTNQLHFTADGGLTWTLGGSNINNLNNIIKYISYQNRYYSISKDSNNLNLSYSEDDGDKWNIIPQFNNIILGEIESSVNGKVFIGGNPDVYYKIPDYSSHPDYNTLVALYNSTNGDNWTNKTNWLDTTKPISSWYGVIETDGKVSQLSLDYNNLTGNIPSEIGDFTNLENLYLVGNDLTGEIPEQIWTLTNIKNLWLGIQSSKQLTLNNRIPSTISDLQNLVWLNLTNVEINQALPQELFDLPNLTRIRMAGCKLFGSLPSGIANIDNVILSDNNFEGAIPQEIINSVGNSSLIISNNFFNFSNLKPLVDANNYTSLGYSPQRTKDIAQNLAFAPGSDIVLNIDDTSLNKTISSKGDGDEYQWYKDNLAINGATAINYNIVNAQETDSGIYYCEITNDLLPDLTINRANITILIDAALSTEELATNGMNIYPNPTKNLLHVKLTQFERADASLYDISGRLILKQNLSNKLSIIDIQNLTSGMYIINIEIDNKTVTKRIIKL